MSASTSRGAGRGGRHLGEEVSALIDGQLTAPAAERAWSHVVTCARCRGLVERETWLKSRLSGLSHQEPPRSPGLSRLYDVAAWSQVDELERAGRRRRSLAVGVGSVGVAMVGVVTFLGVPGVASPLAGDRDGEPAIATEIGDVVLEGVGATVDFLEGVAE